MYIDCQKLKYEWCKKYTFESSILIKHYSHENKLKSPFELCVKIWVSETFLPNCGKRSFCELPCSCYKNSLKLFTLSNMFQYVYFSHLFHTLVKVDRLFEVCILLCHFSYKRLVFDTFCCYLWLYPSQSYIKVLPLFNIHWLA